MDIILLFKIFGYYIEIRLNAYFAVRITIGNRANLYWGALRGLQIILCYYKLYLDNTKTDRSLY